MREYVYTTRFDEDVQTNNQCPECGGHVTTNIAETVCEECGLVLSEEEVDRGPEWRSFDEASRRRTGGPRTPRRHDNGLSTEIGFVPDGGSTGVSAEKRRRLGRLRQQHKRSQFRSKRERNLAHGLGEVQRIGSAMGLGESVGAQAAQLFRSAQSADLLPGRSIESMAAAAVYGACRCNGLARTLDDVHEFARGDHSGLVNAYKTLNRELGLPTQPVTPREFVPRLASALDLPDAVRRQARTYAEQAEHVGRTTGKHPVGFAAACLYVASQDAGWRLTQRRTAELAETAVATIRSHRDTIRALPD